MIAFSRASRKEELKFFEASSDKWRVSPGVRGEEDE
jgi:hypothetical protein